MTDKHHPMTDDTIRYVKKLGCHDLGTWIYTENDLRAAADWQLEQVMKWLGRNISNYTDDDYQSSSYGDCEPLDTIEGDLKKAMSPTKTQEETDD